MLKLSIITINLNNCRGLEKTIWSVINQKFTSVEHLVIDGASTDKSVEIIKRHEGNITYWVSEPDKGIYNAMNKGIAKATGEYCLFLNSGDVLVDKNTIENVFLAMPTEDILYGDMFFDKRLQTYPDELTLNYLIDRSLGHGASIIKRELFIKYGNFDEQLKIVADWEFFFRVIILKSCSYRHLKNQTISRFNMDGVSTSHKHIERHNQEKISVFKKMLPELIQNDFDKEVIAKSLLKLSLYENSKLSQVALRIENSRFFYLFKKLYHSI